MAQANSFSHIGAACVRVLARQAAIALVKLGGDRQELRRLSHDDCEIRK